MKKRNQKEIQFTEDFATKKKGDKMLVTVPLAHTLVRARKVAEWVEDEDKEREKRAQSLNKKAEAASKKAAKVAQKNSEQKKEGDKAVREENYKNVNPDDLPDDVKKAVAEAEKSEKADKKEDTE